MFTFFLFVGVFPVAACTASRLVSCVQAKRGEGGGGREGWPSGARGGKAWEREEGGKAAKPGFSLLAGNRKAGLGVGERVVSYLVSFCHSHLQL